MHPLDYCCVPSLCRVDNVNPVMGARRCCVPSRRGISGQFEPASFLLKPSLALHSVDVACE